MARAGLQESWNVTRMWSFRDGSRLSLPCRIRSAVNSMRWTIFVDRAFSKTVPVIGDRMVGAAPPVEPLLAEPDDAESPQYLMIVEGVSLPRVAGRVDDFIWPPRRKAIFAAEPVVEGATAEATADKAAN